MEMCIQRLHLFVIWICIQYYISLSGGLSWTEEPNEYTLVKLGFNITIKWQYRMQENETFYHSEIQNIASRPYIDTSFKLLKEFKDPFVKVSGKWNVSLTIINAQKSNSKKYCCWITFGSNKIPAKTGNCTTLIVYDPPRILFHTPDKLLTQTANFTLRCNSSGDPISTLYWTKDNIYKSIGNSSTLKVTITGKKTEGKYCCHAKNEYGDDTACTTVNVTEYQPTKTILTTNTNYTIRNKTLRILCWAEASPPAHYLIYQGKVKLGNFNNGNVTITTGNGTRENISCISKNKYGEGTPAYLSIPIYELPDLKRQPNTSITMTTSNITLHCKATGIPTPTITWLDDKNNTLNQTSIDKRDGSLQISHRNCSNNTLRYYCVASNGVGRTRSSLITIQVIRYSSTDICSTSKVTVNTEKPTVHETSFNLKIIVVVAIICALGILIMILVSILCLRKKNKSKVNTRRADQNRKYPEEESPYGEPIDAIQVSSSHQTSSVNYASASNADYATVEETGYKRGGDVNYLPASGIKVDDTAYATVLNSKSHNKKPKADPVYASVNKKNKKKKNKNNVHSIPLSEDIPCNKPASTSDSMSPSSQTYGDHDEQLMNHPEYENALDKCNEKCKNEELDGLDGSGQTSTGYSWAY